MSMRSLVRDVAAFHDQVKIPRVGFPLGMSAKSLSELMPLMKKTSEDLMSSPQDTCLHRTGLVLSEMHEKIHAIQARGMREIAQESIDVIYICIGTLLALGLSPLEIELAWDAVHRSNMTKVGTLATRFKTESYVPPKLDFLLGPKLEERNDGPR